MSCAAQTVLSIAMHGSTSTALEQMHAHTHRQLGTLLINPDALERVPASVAHHKKLNTCCQAYFDSATLVSPADAPLISPDDLRAQLGVIAGSRCVVVLLVDLLDASGSFLVKARDIAGKNPIVLVGTKVCSWLLLTLRGSGVVPLGPVAVANVLD